MENSKLKIMPNIRLRKIILDDFRNIKHSEVDIPNGKMEEFLSETPSILGLYGQNGSGKTSLLMAINALKTALTGDEFSYQDFSSCIRSGASRARLEFEFSAFYPGAAQFDFYYGFSLSIEDVNQPLEITPEESDDENTAVLNAYMRETYSSASADVLQSSEKKIIVSDEVLQYGGVHADGEKINKQVMIDTSEEACKKSKKAFGNKLKYDQLTFNGPEDIHKKLNDWKTEARVKSTSFIFCRKVFRSLVTGNGPIGYRLYLAALNDYAENYLFVVMTNSNLKNLPFVLWINKGDRALAYTCPLSLTDHCRVPEAIFQLVKKSIKATSDVISKIVPGMIIELSDIGKVISDKGVEAHLFDLVSNRKGVRIPLLYESDGIRRMILFLTLLIAVYNDPSVTVAIDEIDSGIFEYMLGEILSILGESAKGQLIFTSHNLRPLEVLPPKYLLFTTVNSERRFAKLEGISGNNNLRDCYFRTIDLGTGKDAFYDATDTFNIEQALFEAGQTEEQ